VLLVEPMSNEGYFMWAKERLRLQRLEPREDDED
jgi:hypothetical protein